MFFCGFCTTSFQDFLAEHCGLHQEHLEKCRSQVQELKEAPQDGGKIFFGKL